MDDLDNHKARGKHRICRSDWSPSVSWLVATFFCFELSAGTFLGTFQAFVAPHDILRTAIFLCRRVADEHLISR